MVMNVEVYAFPKSQKSHVHACLFVFHKVLVVGPSTLPLFSFHSPNHFMISHKCFSFCRPRMLGKHSENPSSAPNNRKEESEKHRRVFRIEQKRKTRKSLLLISSLFIWIEASEEELQNPQCTVTLDDLTLRRPREELARPKKKPLIPIAKQPYFTMVSTITTFSSYFNFAKYKLYNFFTQLSRLLK